MFHHCYKQISSTKNDTQSLLLFTIPANQVVFSQSDTMEQYIYILLYLIIEAMIIWILEWRERGWEETRSITWVKRKLIKMKQRRRKRIRKNKQLARQKILLVSYLRYLQKVKMDEATAKGSLASMDESVQVLTSNRQCRTPRESANSLTSETVKPSSDFGTQTGSDSVKIGILSCDVTQDEPVAGEINDRESVSSEVTATIDAILSIVCENPSTDETMDKETDDIKTTIDNSRPVYETNAREVYPRFEVEIKKVEADEITSTDNKIHPEVTIPKQTTRPFLFDSEISAANRVSSQPVPRPLIPFTDFGDVTFDHDVLTGKDGQSWECEDMFRCNEHLFGYKSTLDEDLSEYTTPLVREDSEEYRLRWERACRLSKEINTKKLADQAMQVSKKRKRKKVKKANITTSSEN